MPYSTKNRLNIKRKVEVSQPRVKFTSVDAQIALELSKIEEHEQLIVRELQLEFFWNAIRDKKDWKLRLEILIAYLEKDLYSQKLSSLWFNNGKIQQFLISLRYLESINYLDLKRYISEIERLVILSEWVS